MKKAPLPNALARAVRGFFGEYVPELRGLSRHTLLSYRDTLALLLRFVAKLRRCDPASLDLEAISPEAVLAFLNYLEKERHSKTSTRNVRLAGIHAFFRYVVMHAPERIEQAQRILAIPFKRTGTRPIEYLESDEVGAILDTIDRTPGGCGVRDYALLALLFNSGARVQEIVDLNVVDLQLDAPPHVRLSGKGRKTRICPLWPQTAEVLKEFIAQTHLDLHSKSAVFCNQRGERLSRFGIRYILAKYCQRATAACPTLAGKRLHPHSMRHSCAVHLLKSGVDLPSISHWLGHASVDITNRYARVDLEMKRQAIARAGPPAMSLSPPAAWRRDASIIEWLESL
jgi:site-specific recombinase XerD